MNNLLLKKIILFNNLFRSVLSYRLERPYTLNTDTILSQSYLRKRNLESCNTIKEQWSSSEQVAKRAKIYIENSSNPIRKRKIVKNLSGKKLERNKLTFYYINTIFQSNLFRENYERILE